jgi:hypothetical protein
VVPDRTYFSEFVTFFIVSVSTEILDAEGAIDKKIVTQVQFFFQAAVNAKLLSEQFPSLMHNRSATKSPDGAYLGMDGMVPFWHNSQIMKVASLLE